MVRRFLLIKLGHLGDTLLLTPALHAVREAYPDAEIDVMVRRGCEVMLQGNQDVNRILLGGRPESDRRSLWQSLNDDFKALRRVLLRRYDFAFDLSDSDRSKLWILLSGSKVRGHNDHGIERRWSHRLFNARSHFEWPMEHQVLRDYRTIQDITGLKSGPGPLRFEASPDRTTIRRIFPWLEHGEPYAVIHPTSRWSFKEWPAGGWARVASMLKHDHGLNVVISCGPDPREIQIAETICGNSDGAAKSVAGRLSIPELASLLAGARVFLGIDTVTMHLAAAMQTPTVALFGQSSEWSWRPWQVRHELVLGPCSCKKTRVFSCDKSTIYPCMSGISAGEVMDAATRLLTET